ncbi:MAG: acyltransferase [Rhodobiaceae bacterium]|nr:MAG: acyltransferase [Rhodobiaceae bacterium]
MNYRPEIDGLRALAVLPVILFHAGFDVFSGGFVGVDVFFVISGYLITGLIYRDIVGGTFSIVHFYERRIRRILPALFFVCVVTLPFAWAWMLPEELESFSQSLVAVNLYASNVLFWRETNYFAEANELKPLLHTWSLAVEEQFYVLFPLLLLMLRKTERGLITAILFCAVIASLFLSEWMSRTHPAASFYLLPTRAWELGVGALLAITLPRRDCSIFLRQGLSSLGLILILAPVFIYDASVPFPGVSALVPVLGAALIISYANGDTLVGAGLRLKPVVGLGLVSYSAYLWHQPLFAFARIRSLDDLSNSELLILSGMSIVLAYLSWRFVEQPFRKRNVFSRKAIFFFAAVFSIVLIGVGSLTIRSDGFPRRLPAAAAVLIEQPTFSTDSWKQCFASDRKYIEPDNACISDSSLPRTAAIWGDSHAMALSDALASSLAEDSISLKYFSYAGCAPALGYRRNDMIDECPRFNNAVFDTLSTDREIEVIVLFARWALYIEGVPFDNKEGRVEMGEPIYAVPLGSGEDFLTDPTRIDQIGALYRRTVEDLLTDSKRVVLVYPVPEVGWRVPVHLAKEIWFKVDRKESLSTSFDVFRDRTRNTREQLDLLPDHPNLIRIRPEEIFCNTYVADRCVAQLNGASLYFDDDHLNAEGSSMLSEKITDAMRANGWLQPSH